MPVATEPSRRMTEADPSIIFSCNSAADVSANRVAGTRLRDVQMTSTSPRASTDCCRTIISRLSPVTRAPVMAAVPTMPPMQRVAASKGLRRTFLSPSFAMCGYFHRRASTRSMNRRMTAAEVMSNTLSPHMVRAPGWRCC